MVAGAGFEQRPLGYEGNPAAPQPIPPDQACEMAGVAVTHVRGKLGPVVARSRRVPGEGVTRGRRRTADGRSATGRSGRAAHWLRLLRIVDYHRALAEDSCHARVWPHT